MWGDISLWFYFEYSYLIRYTMCRSFLSVWVVLSLPSWCPLEHKCFILMMKSNLPLPNLKSLLCLLLALTLRPLIHLELIFVCGVRYGPHSLLLRVDIQWSWHHLLKRKTIFSPLIYLGFFVENQLAILTSFIFGFLVLLH